MAKPKKPLPVFVVKKEEVLPDRIEYFNSAYARIEINHTKHTATVHYLQLPNHCLCPECRKTQFTLPGVLYGQVKRICDRCKLTIIFEFEILPPNFQSVSNIF